MFTESKWKASFTVGLQLTNAKFPYQLNIHYFLDKSFGQSNVRKEDAF